MQFAPKRLFVAGLLTTIAAAAMAQTPPAAPAAGGGHAMHDRMGQRDPAKMKEYMAKRQAELKAKLAITPAQEPAWTAWTATMQPPATRPAHPSREEIARLSTPERIDKMRAQGHVAAAFAIDEDIAHGGRPKPAKKTMIGSKAPRIKLGISARQKDRIGIAPRRFIVQG